MACLEQQQSGNQGALNAEICHAHVRTSMTLTLIASVNDKVLPKNKTVSYPAQTSLSPSDAGMEGLLGLSGKSEPEAWNRIAAPPPPLPFGCVPGALGVR